MRHTLGWDQATAEDRARELRSALDTHPYLADLATRPLLLTLTATLHSHKSRMPEDRADLFEFAAGLLLNRWQESRQVKDAEGKWMLDQGIERVLGLGEARLREAVEELALHTHRKQRQSATGREEAARNIPADIPLGDVLVVFSKQIPHDLNPLDLVNYLENRAGLLIGRGEGIYTFPHRSFQEYLAACRLANTERDFAGKLRMLVEEDMDWWREVFLLGVGKKRQGGLGDAVDILNRLVHCKPNETSRKTDWHWRAATLAAEAALDLRLPERAPGNEYYQTVYQRLQTWLAALLTDGHLSPRERLEAGDILGKLGDPRPGVALLPSPSEKGVTLLPSPRGRGAGDEGTRLPDIDWVKIPAGPFRMGSKDDDEQAWDDEIPQHTLTLPDYWISRYPVTNAQFRPFVEGDGYSNPNYWTPEGWAWRQGAVPDFSPLETYGDQDSVRRYKEWILGRADRGKPHYWEDPKWGAATRPVVGITWYEAAAFCVWLGGRVSGIRDQVRPNGWQV